MRRRKRVISGRADGLLPVDHHVHTARCGHATGTPAEYAKEGERLAGMGFNDHLPFLDRAMADPELAMAYEELPAYVEDVLKVRGETSAPILLGVEADYMPAQEGKLAEVLAELPLDYVYGSVHWIGDWPFDDSRGLERYRRADMTALYRNYYALVADMARTGLFDVWAHPDVPKKFGRFPEDDVTDAENAALAAVAAAGMVMEINTAGLRKPVGEIYPAPGLLRRAREAGIPITFGSDAHRPEEVGYEFARAVTLARDAGYEEYITFSLRERTIVPLPGTREREENI
jgi:histidinol-phosphatase (PHP family)